MMRRSLLFVPLVAFGCRATAPPAPALPEVRSVVGAITTTIRKAPSARAEQPGWLGVHLDGLRIVDVAPGSPAGKAGVLAGDLLLEFAGEEPGDVEDLRNLVQARAPGDKISLTVEREGRAIEMDVELGAVSRPMQPAERRAVLGLQTGDALEGGGVPVARVSSGSAAEKAGVRNGDVLLEIDGVPLGAELRLADRIAEKNPGDAVTLLLRRGESKLTLKAELAADRNEGDGYNRGGSLWRKEVYRLALVPVEFADTKRNPKIEREDWEELLFSKGTYAGKNNATGQAVHGSLNDYYLEQSCGAFRVEGKVFDWIEAGKKRLDYGQGTGSRDKTVLLAEALDKLLAREGKEALKDVDGLCFLYAGERVQTNRGGLYWPHRASVTHQGRRWPYFIVPEGGSRMSSISVIAHEFGHLLGLPDLYARPENPGSEGLGAWCAMSNENGNGRPQHFSAWCKERLGWLAPAVVDPTVKQRIVLGPIEGASKECVKVLVRPDGSEYFLLENRRRTGFDRDLPAEGLLVWRVVRNRPILEESHGVEGAAGPGVFRGAVPYPSAANDAFTPHTTPSSRSLLGGGLPVHITQIRRLPDGKIAFSLGIEYD